MFFNFLCYSIFFKNCFYNAHALLLKLEKIFHFEKKTSPSYMVSDVGLRHLVIVDRL